MRGGTKGGEERSRTREEEEEEGDSGRGWKRRVKGVEEQGGGDGKERRGDRETRWLQCSKK